MRHIPSILAATVLILSSHASAAAAAQPTGSIEWQPCENPNSPARLQCATLNVPIDWADPDGPTFALKLNRLPAKNPEKRIGSLMVNPGGPGGAATDVVAYNGMVAGTQETKELADRFDIVGMDPRGVGGSSPVQCDPALLHDPGVGMFPTDQASFDRLAALNEAAGNDCARRSGPLIEHVDTVSVARDMDAVRAGLGEDKISFYGMSYGGEVGEMYADLFGEHVRAMVLDAPVDHAVPTILAAGQEAAAIEDEFNRFADWCSTTTDCALHGTDVRAIFDRLLSSGEIPAPAFGRPISAEELTKAVYGYLNMRMTWPALAEGLAAASAPNPDASALARVLSVSAPYRAVGCHDFAADVRGPEHVVAEKARLQEAAPRMWRYSELWDFAAGCVGWPIPAANPPAPRLITGVPSVLVIGGTHDPAIPLEWARGLSSRIIGSSLLVDDRDGHTALYHSPDARTAATNYLINGDLPDENTGVGNNAAD